MGFLTDLLNVKRQEEIRLDNLHEILDIDLDYVQDRLFSGDEDLLSIVYEKIFEEAREYFSTKGIKELCDYGISTYGNYSDTHYEFSNESANKLEKEINNLLSEDDYKDMSENIKWFLNTVLDWSL